MAARAELPMFACEDCGSVSITISGPMNELAPVQCGGCGKELGPWDFFADELHRRLAEHGIKHVRHGKPYQTLKPN